MPELIAGEKLLYVADAGHWNELGPGGMPLFVFAYEQDGPLNAEGNPTHKAGDETCELKLLQQVERELDGGVLLLKGEPRRTLRVVRPKAFWPAEVAEGTAGPELLVTHPNGFVKISIPLAGPNALPHDPTGTRLHSWHRAGEAR